MMRSLVLLCMGTLAAQFPTLPHYVLADVGGPSPSVVFQVDPIAGTTQVVHTLQTSGAPLALVQDPIDGDLLVACDGGPNGSELFRLHAVGGGYVEFAVGTAPGRVSGLRVWYDVLFVAVDAIGGGLYRMPRRGGPLVLAAQVDDLTAIDTLGSSYVVLARTGRIGGPPSAVGIIHGSTGTFALPMTSFADPLAREIVGIVDLPTAVPRQLLAFDDGSFAMFSSLQNPLLQPLPFVNAGGNVAMCAASPYTPEALVLGGAPPRLARVDPWATALAPVSVALPAAAADLSAGIDALAHSVGYGSPCGPQPVSTSWQVGPVLGQQLMMFALADANAPLLWIAGLDDFDLGQLPMALPGGCELHVRPDVVFFVPADATGLSSVLLDLPAMPSLVGEVLHVQWARYDPAVFSTSHAVAHWLGY